METISQKRSSSIDDDNQRLESNSSIKRKKPMAISSTNTNDSPITGSRISDWEEYDKWKEVRGDIEPTMNYVEITPEAIEELSRIKNIIGDYVCQLCKVKYENAFALAMHKCPRVVHIEFRCPECDKTFNCPANLASHRRWHKPQTSSSTNEPSIRVSTTNNRNIRCSSRSDSRSTNTSSSTNSETTTNVQDFINFHSTLSDSSKFNPTTNSSIHQRAADQILRNMFNAGSQKISPSALSPFSNGFIKGSPFFGHHRPLSISSISPFDARGLQSSCIFCQEQFSDLSQLIQHIRKNHAVQPNNNPKPNSFALDKIFF